MHNKFFKSFGLLIFILLFTMLVGCGSDSSNVKSKYVLYTDSDPIENNEIKIEIEKSYCFGYDNYNVSIELKITNKTYKEKAYKIKNETVIKESTGAKYKVNFNWTYEGELIIEPELNSSIRLESTIPNSITTDKYKMLFTINNYQITYYLYETPDELREDRNINYFIDNELVFSSKVKDGRTVDSLYVYESADYTKYCDTWCIDRLYGIQFTSSTRVTSDINLFGVTKSCIRFSTTSTDLYTFVTAIDHMPSNGLLILPEKYLNKELCIGLNAIKNLNVSTIYIPKTVHVIYSGNFTGIASARINYAGTESEWKSLFFSSSDIVTKNVYYGIRFNNED